MSTSFEQAALDKFAKFLVEIYDQAYNEGYNQAKLESQVDLDTALIDAQRAGFEAGRTGIINEVTAALDHESKLRLISDLEAAIHRHHKEAQL